MAFPSVIFLHLTYQIKNLYQICENTWNFNVDQKTIIQEDRFQLVLDHRLFVNTRYRCGR